MFAQAFFRMTLESQILPWPLHTPRSVIITILVAIAIGIVWMIIKPESKD